MDSKTHLTVNLKTFLQYNVEKLSLEIKKESLIEQIETNFKDLNNIEERLKVIVPKTKEYNIPLELNVFRDRALKNIVAIISVRKKRYSYKKGTIPDIFPGLPIDDFVFSILKELEKIQQRRLSKKVLNRGENNSPK